MPHGMLRPMLLITTAPEGNHTQAMGRDPNRVDVEEFTRAR